MHDQSSLFAQLGLPSDDAAIDGFIAAHGPLPSAMLLNEALFWTPVRPLSCKEGTLADSDWAEAIYALNRSLHELCLEQR